MNFRWKLYNGKVRPQMQGRQNGVAATANKLAENGRNLWSRLNMKKDSLAEEKARGAA